MKIIAVLLIISYLILPTICCGHPCDLLSQNSEQISIAFDSSSESPLQHITDSCETTCCCAGHTPISTFTAIKYSPLTARQFPYEPDLALPRLIDRIFVPPQNRS
jgi:hypothetical protein